MGLCNDSEKVTLGKKNNHQDHTQTNTPLSLDKSQDGKWHNCEFSNDKETQAPQATYQTLHNIRRLGNETALWKTARQGALWAQHLNRKVNKLIFTSKWNSAQVLEKRHLKNKLLLLLMLSLNTFLLQPQSKFFF